MPGSLSRFMKKQLLPSESAPATLSNQLQVQLPVLPAMIKRLRNSLLLALSVVAPMAATAATTDLAGNALTNTTPTSTWDTYIVVVAPTVTTATATSVAQTSATLGGNVTDAGSGTVSDRGVVYSTTNATPTTADTKVAIGTGAGSFSQSVTGLTANTTYHVRAYAINEAGTSYGTVSDASTLPNAPVITSATTASGTYGSSITTYTIAATNSPTSYGATGLPSGLSVNTSNGQITGTPTDRTGSPYSVTISATNAGGTGSATLVLTLAKRSLVITAGITATPKTYDGTTAATLTAGTLTFSGKVTGDDVSIDASNVTGAFVSKDVGNRAAAITTSSLVLTGTKAANYSVLATNTAAVAISAKALTVSGLTGADRVYDGTTTAGFAGTATLSSTETAGSGSTSDGKPYSVDSASLMGTAAGTFATKDVGTSKAITVTGLTLTGTGSTNYTVTQPTGLTANVTAKPVAITGLSAAASRVYDGTTAMAVTGVPGLQTAETAGAGTASDGLPYTGDTVTVSGTAVGGFADRHVGTAKTITVSGLSLSGADSANYSIGSTTLTANITAKALTVSGLSGVDRIYDGTTSAALTGSAAFAAAEATTAGTTSDGKPYDVDSVTAGGTAAGAFADRNVANGKGVTVTGVTVTGTGSSNYTVTQPTGLTANVTAKSLAVSGLSAVASRVYDGTTVAGLSGTPAFLPTEAAGAGTTSDGKPYTVDTISVGGSASGVFADRHVATGKTVSVSGLSVSGTDAANYTLTSPSLTASITAKALTVSGLTAVSTRVYDGTAAAGLLGTPAFLTSEAAGAGSTTDGKPYSGDTISVGGTAAGTFADRHAAIAKAVTVSGITVTGTDSADYTVTQPTGLSANITAKALSVSGLTAVSSQVYNGTTTASLTGTPAFASAEAAGAGNTSDGKPYSVDSVTAGGTAAGAFADRNVATGKAITVTGITVTGTGNANYTVTQPTGLTADVTAKPLTVSGLSAVSSRIYDGTTVAGLTGTPAFLTTETAGTGTTSDGKPYDVDSVSIAGTATGAFADRNVATGKAVTVTGLTVSGTGSSNYSATQPTGLTGSITAKALSVSGVTAVATRAYDGTTVAGLSGTPAFATTEAAGTGSTSDGKPYDVDSVTVGGTAAGAFATRHVGTGKTITVSGISATGTGSTNYTVTQPTGLTADVTAKNLTISGLTAVTSRVYDGTTAAGVNGTAAFLTSETAGAGTTTDGKPYDVDTISVGGSATGAFADRHVATGKSITVTGLTVGGTDAANYSVTQPTGLTGAVTAKALDVSGLSAVASRVYDGTTTAALTGSAALAASESAGAGTTSDGKPYTVDTVSMTGTAVGAFADRHVATGKAVTVSGLSLTGTNASNYTLNSPAGLTASITKKTLDVSGVTATNKVYDGALTAPLGGTPALLASESAGAGTTSDRKPYSLDTVSVTGTPAGTFGDRHVATAKAVTVTGVSLTGANATNYSVAQPTGLAADITPKALTVSGVTAANKVYDGTVAASLNGTPALPTSETVGQGNTADGKPYTGDTVSLAGTMTGAFADRHAATGKTVTVSGLTLTGAENNNYSIGGLTATANITAKPLSISGVAATNRAYDGTTVAPLTGTPFLSNAEAAGTGTTNDGAPYSGDDVTLGSSASGAFGDRHVATGKAITVTGLTLSGAQASNYSATQPTGLTANITAKTLTVVGVTASNRVYDGSTAAPLGGSAALQAASAAGAGTTSDGKPYDVDTVSVTGTATGAFADRHVATGKAITVSGLSLTGTNASNYAVSQPTGLTADVTAKTLTSSGLAAVARIYDGTTVAPLTGSAVLQSAIAPGTGSTSDGKPYTGDTVSISGIAAGTFLDRHVGAGKPVSISGLTLSGAQNANYALAAPTGVTGTVTAKALSVQGLTGASRVYDGTNNGPLTGTAALLTAQAPGSGTGSDGKPYTSDTVSVAGTATATFGDKLVGTAKTLTVTGLTLTGTQASNYTVTQPGSLTASITAKALTVTGVTAANKAYDGNTTATLSFTSAALVGVLNADTVNLVSTGGTGTFANANAAAAKVVTIAGLTLGGTDASNYTLTQPTATATITAATATVTFAGLSQTYNGSARSVTATTSPSGLPVAITYNSGSSAPTNAGTYAVSATVSDANYSGSATGTLVVAQATQSVSFAAISVTGSTATLSATASSGLPVTFSVVSGNATVTGSTLTLTGSGSVVVRATQAGNANFIAATADQTVSVAKKAQTISFDAISNYRTTDAPFSLSATASSGLPVTFTIVSGPATISGNQVTLSGSSGAVVIRASQAGNASYDAAPNVDQSFNVIGSDPHQVFFGLTQNGDTIAAVIAPDNSSGTLICFIGATGEAFVVTFTINPDGTFDATVTALGHEDDRSPVTIAGRTVARAVASRTFSGRLTGGTITGKITELGLNFSVALQPRTGPTAQIAGLYQSSALNSAAGTTASIVGTQGQVLVVASTATVTTGAVGTVATDGKFTVQAPGATIAGTVDAPTTTVSGTILVPNQVPVNYSGLSTATIRTDRLVNLSSRGRIGPASGRTLITGFVIGGTDAKRVLLRAVGPALSAYGVSGVIGNPQLEVYNAAGQRILQNDDWSGTDTAAAFAQVGAFNLPSGGRDAALVATLAPGAYTMHVIDGGQTGVALAEIYDAGVNPNSEYQRLINISSRGTVEGGEGLLIGGFVVTGNSPKKVLIRGVGPTLAPFGVSGPLADPKLEVYNGQTLVAKNDDWSTPTPIGATQVAASATEIAAAARATGAFALGANSKDAAIMVTLAPGAYTAQVISADGTTGVALVEIYEISE
jgi:hypothetical protein